MKTTRFTVNAQKRWLAVFAASCLICYGLLLPLYNYMVDAYGIYRSDYSKLKFEPNMNYVQTKHVITNPDRYSIFAMGSSRVGHIDVHSFYGERAYNLSFPEAVPSEHAAILQQLLKRGVQVERVIMGVDHISYHTMLKVHQNYHRTRLYPVGLAKSLAFHRFYLYRSPTQRDKDLITGDGHLNQFEWQFSTTGRGVCDRCEQVIDEDPQKHLRNPEFDIPRSSYGFYLREEVEQIEHIVSIARKHGIKLDLFINPLFEATYLDIDLAQFERFKRDLVQLTPFYDFSGLNVVTTDRSKYLEASHYRESVGIEILRIIEAGGRKEVAAFGTLVTADNIDRHLSALESQFQMQPEVLDRLETSRQFDELVAHMGVSGAPRMERYGGHAPIPDRVKDHKRCSVDWINLHLLSEEPLELERDKLPALTLSGWSAPPKVAEVDALYFIQLSRQPDGDTFYFPAQSNKQRRDVLAVIPDVDTEYLGFEYNYDPSSLPEGTYSIAVVHLSDSARYRCVAGGSLRLLD